MNSWLVVADSSHARFLQVGNDRQHHLEELSTLVNPFARLKEGNLVSDGPGSHNDGKMGGQHRMPQKHTAKSAKRTDFAREIGSSLDQAAQRHEFDKLYIIAAPRFLGELRSQLSERVQSQLAGELGKDITRFSLTDIQQAFNQLV